MGFVQGWYFALASMFAMMMYMLGFLLIAVPVPKAAGLKRYGRRLIHESFDLIVTIFILNVFLAIVLSWQDVVWCAIYGTPSNCGIVGIEAFQKDVYRLVVEGHQRNVNTVNTAGLGTAVVIGVINVIGALAAPSGASLGAVLLAPIEAAQAGSDVAEQLAYILSPVSGLYGTGLLVSTFVVYFVEFIYNNWALLAAFGVLLTIMPFNIGKKAGFFLIAFPVICYIMIPLHALLAPILAESIAGFAASLPGGRIVGSVVDPTIIGMALAAPVTYLTFTTLAMGGLAAFTGASNIPIRGLPLNIGQMSHRWVEEAKRVVAGSPEAKQAGMGGLSTAKRVTGIVQKEYRYLKYGMPTLGFKRWLEGRTPSGERIKVPVTRSHRRWKQREQALQYFHDYRRPVDVKRDGIFPVPSEDVKRLREGPKLDLKRKPEYRFPAFVVTKKGERVDVEKAMAQGRLVEKRSLLPHRLPGERPEWGRSDLFSRTGREVRRRMTLRTARHDEKKLAEEAAAGLAWALGETPPQRSGLRSALDKFKESTMYRPRPPVRVVHIEHSLTPVELGIWAAATAKYESDASLREAWRSHIMGRNPAEYPEIADAIEYGTPDLRNPESYYFKKSFRDAYEGWEKGTLTDMRDRGFFAAYAKQIDAIRPRAIRRGGYYIGIGTPRIGRTPLGPFVTDGGVSPEDMEKMRQLWTDDPAAQGGLGAAARLYTRFWKLNEAAHPSADIAAMYDVGEKYCEMWTTSKHLSEPHTAHYVVAHEQVGHATFHHGFLPYAESEFTKVNPYLKPAWMGHYATIAKFGLDGEYIKMHPDQLGVTYEKVASFTEDQIPLSLKQLRDDWATRIDAPFGLGEQVTDYPLRGAVLEQLYEKSLLERDVLHNMSEYHLEFHCAPSGELTGFSVYRQRLSGEAEVARERLMRFNRAIAETGGLTEYMYGRLTAGRHIADNYARLRYSQAGYVDNAISESFAECTAVFTATDRSKTPSLRVENLSSPKVRELEDAWRGVAEFIGERAIRDEAVYAGYPYWENV